MGDTVLVVGGGGREHALAWALAKSPQVDEVLVAPGNAGTAVEPGCRNLSVKASDREGLVAAAREHAVRLVVVGPEDPLVDGLVDACEAAGIPAFGPSAAAAQLEGSKAHCKAFLLEHGIPTGAAATFTDAESALAYLETLDAVPVVKASGLAAGKGVIVAETFEAEIQAEGRLLGEFTVVVEGAPESDVDRRQAQAMVAALVAAGVGPGVVRDAVAGVFGLPRRDIYQWALAAGREEEG